MRRSAVVVATGYGGPEVLEIVEQEVAEPRPGEAVLDVRAAGVNPVDWKMYSGARGRDPSALPMRLGMEGSGGVVAVGAEAAGRRGRLAAGGGGAAYCVSDSCAQAGRLP